MPDHDIHSKFETLSPHIAVMADFFGDTDVAEWVAAKLEEVASVPYEKDTRVCSDFAKELFAYLMKNLEPDKYEVHVLYVDQYNPETKHALVHVAETGFPGRGMIIEPQDKTGLLKVYDKDKEDEGLQAAVEDLFPLKGQLKPKYRLIFGTLITD